MPKTTEQKQWEAEERRNDYELRSIEEQLAELDERPGNSTRERDKLLHLKKELTGIKIHVPQKTAKKGAKK